MSRLPVAAAFRPAALLFVAALSACGPAAIPDGIQDPHEAQNRAVHEENKQIDRTLLKPVSGGYGETIPKPLRQGVGHFADNVDTPRMAVNALLQGRIEDAVHSTLRFVVNTTVGVAGVWDPATKMGLDRRNTDFGETLFVWGATEGDYVELPLIGPSTERDMAGKVVDLFLNPLSYVLSKPESNLPTYAAPLAKLGDRFTYGSTVDSVLYDSADSYAQARSLYLQNSRYKQRRLLKGGAEDFVDPYVDGAGAAPADDGYVDPYEDQ